MHNILRALHRKPKFFRKRLEVDTIEQSSLDELSVALVENMLVNKLLPLGARQVKIVDVKHLINCVRVVEYVIAQTPQPPMPRWTQAA